MAIGTSRSELVGRNADTGVGVAIIPGWEGRRGGKGELLVGIVGDQGRREKLRRVVEIQITGRIVKGRGRMRDSTARVCVRYPKNHKPMMVGRKDSDSSSGSICIEGNRKRTAFDHR
jgi:hypothetical protein